MEHYRPFEKDANELDEKQLDVFENPVTQDSTDRIDFSGRNKHEAPKDLTKIFDVEKQGNKINFTEARAIELKDKTDLNEQQKIKQASEEIKKIEGMQPEVWKSLDIIQKKWRLVACGRVLRDVYHSPDPPLYLEKTKEAGLQGSYGDGDKYYGIKMYEYENISEKLENDFYDPKAALKTFAHEFRHSYQKEQALRYNREFIGCIDNYEKAKEWAENFDNYKEAPENSLFKTNSEKYHKEAQEYKNQPVEKDAQTFAENLVKSVYG